MEWFVDFRLADRCKVNAVVRQARFVGIFCGRFFGFESILCRRTCLPNRSKSREKRRDLPRSMICSR
jgi:hypothetical protein